MSQVEPQSYQVKKISMIAKGSDVLVREYALGPGEFIPWHHHTQVTDTYYSLEGRVLIETRAPFGQDRLPSLRFDLGQPRGH